MQKVANAEKNHSNEIECESTPELSKKLCCIYDTLIHTFTRKKCQDKYAGEYNEKMYTTQS